MPLPCSRTQIWPSAYVPRQSTPKRIIWQLQNNYPPDAIATQASTSGHTTLCQLFNRHIVPHVHNRILADSPASNNPVSALIHHQVAIKRLPRNTCGNSRSSTAITTHELVARLLKRNHAGGSRLLHIALKVIHLLPCILMAFRTSNDAPGSDCSSFIIPSSRFSPFHLDFTCSSRPSNS